MKIKLSVVTFFLLFAFTVAKAANDITIGLIVYSGRFADADKTFSELRKEGFGSCEISYDANVCNAELAKKIKKYSKKNGIKTTTVIGVPGSRTQWNFTHGPSTIGLVPEEERQEKIQIYKNMIDFCVEAGVPAMHSHFGFIPLDMQSQQYKDFIVAMKEVANYAKDRGIMIYCETGQETPITLIRAIKDVGTGNIFVNCDLANLLLYGMANALDAVKVFGPYIKEIHAKDGTYPSRDNPYVLGREVPIPTGDVNFPAVIAQLKKQGFKGAITIEYEMGGPQKDYLLKTRKYLQDLVDKD